MNAIELENISRIQFEQESTFESFIEQFQPHFPKILCVVNDKYLRYYDKKGPFPHPIRFDHKQRRGKSTNYYFKDIDGPNCYCIFGIENARRIYPRLDQVDSQFQRTQLNSTVETDKKSSSQITSYPSFHNNSISRPI